MASTATVAVSVTVSDGTKNTVQESYSVNGLTIVAENGKRETLSLSAGANTITPPTGAKGVLLMCQGKVSLTLKGIGGDTGVAIEGASANQIPALIPLSGSVASFVLNSTGAQTLEAIWI